MSFQVDLQSGKSAEVIVADALNKAWGTEFIKNPASMEEDLIDEPTKIEVKNDIMYETTGNIAFEIKYQGAPSGISTTKAQYLAYVIGNELYICATDSLKDWLKRNKGFYKILMGGDGNASTLAVVSKGQFKEVFTKICNL